ncbi:MAG: alkaline phosphatase family protein [Crocinitomicaceae bacterium TMED114]|nr:MAG: alkaline phosphatase family protein [Crocinitomicaceae bacterium TMED114]
MRLLSALLLLCHPCVLLGQAACQPMVGHVGLRDARIWMQATQEGHVLLECWADSLDAPSAADLHSASGEVLALNAWTHTFVVGGLEPGTDYRFRITLNGEEVSEGLTPDRMAFRTQPLWDYRFDPPDFTVALGSCSFINEPAYDRPGKGYGGGYSIFETIAESNPDLMLWLGDNVYFREVDWGSESGMQHRYSHLRRLPELQPLLGACPHYAIWDDHDFGPNNADGSWIHKDWAKSTFESFWPNPSCGLPDRDGQGITSAFRFHDVDFFLMDNRTFRLNPDNLTRTPRMLGEAQIDWLIAALQYSKAPFKVVATGGQVVSDYAAYENFAMFEAEREMLLARIRDEDIHGVVFLTGDRHSSELSALELKSGQTVLDFTCSALTSSTYDHSQEPNHNRLEGTSVGVRNYGTMTLTGPRKERVMTFRTFDAEGELLWERSFAAADL